MNTLPLEIQEKILYKLNSCSLGRAAQVSKEWNELVYGRIWRGVFPKMIREESIFPRNFPVKVIDIPLYLYHPSTLIDGRTILFAEGIKLMKYDIQERTSVCIATFDFIIKSCDSDGKKIIVCSKNSIYGKEISGKGEFELLWKEEEQGSSCISKVKIRGATIAWLNLLQHGLCIFNLSTKQFTINLYPPRFIPQTPLINSIETVLLTLREPFADQFRQYMGGREVCITFHEPAGYQCCYLLDNQPLIFGRKLQTNKLSVMTLLHSSINYEIPGTWADEESEAIEAISNERIAVITRRSSNQTILLRIVDIFKREVLWTKMLSEVTRFSSIKLHATASKVLAIDGTNLKIFHFN